MKPLAEFVAESNRIEGITRPPTQAEIDELERFLALENITVAELESFVKVYQPNARLRDIAGLNVRVGSHTPPHGGIHIRKHLGFLLENISTRSPYWSHLYYETLHPFTDGNGRSGRALWAWQMKEFPLGFLHHFYYQALDSKQ